MSICEQIAEAFGLPKGFIIIWNRIGRPVAYKNNKIYTSRETRTLIKKNKKAKR